MTEQTEHVIFPIPPTSRPCTTEFMGFAKAADSFKGLNCELLGLSIDLVQGARRRGL